jgi:hypothetical protein
MKTKLVEIFAVLIDGLENLSKSCTEDSSSDQFESSFNDLIREFGQSVFQSIVGTIPKSKNDHITILTSFGDVCFPKTHPLSTAPGGFKISPYLQECLCLAGTKMTFEEASEEVKTLKGIEVNAKQIERLCHHYGESLAQVNWGQAYNEAVQLRLPLKDEVTYAISKKGILSYTLLFCFYPDSGMDYFHNGSHTVLMGDQSGGLGVKESS